MTPPSSDTVRPLDVRPIGLILAGGRSSRLGGGDKTLRRLGSTSMLDHILRRFTPQVGAVVLNANGDPARFGSFGLPVVPDEGTDRGTGPLAGLLAGLDRIAVDHPNAAWVASIPADIPLLPPDLVPRLATAMGTGAHDVAAAASGGRRHPLAALWRLDVRHDLRTALRREGVRGAGAFLDRQRTVWVEWPVLPIDPFANVNTPAELTAAERHVSPSGLPDADHQHGPRPLD